MNTTFIIILIIFFTICAEFINWCANHTDKFIYWYGVIVRNLIIALACLAICIINKDNNIIRQELSFSDECNNFKYECIEHLDSVRTLHIQMIHELANHLENEHDCDIPQFDGDLYDNMIRENEIVDSLFKSQL